MSVSSGNASGFMSSLRSSFSSGGGVTIGKLSQLTPTQAVGQATSSSPTVLPPAQPPQPPQSIAQQLEVAEQVLSEFGTAPTPVPPPTPTVSAANVPDSLGSLAQAMPQTLTTVLPDPLNPPHPSPVGQAKKELYQVGPGVPAQELLTAPDAVASESIGSAEAVAPTPEYPSGIQTVEQEPVPEISPEVESFLKQAEQQPDQLPQEIVIADNQEISSVTHHPKQPVVVLPITAQDQAEGKNKDLRFSLRWLVEWSIKIMKKFSGKVIYREEPA